MRAVREIDTPYGKVKVTDEGDGIVLISADNIAAMEYAKRILEGEMGVIARDKDA